MTAPSCAEFNTNDVRERYVAGALGPAETEAFERHLIACADCQRAVRLGGAIRHELATSGSGATAVPMVLRRTTYAALAIAAGVALVASMRLMESSRLRALGQVTEAPAYGGVAVRSVQRQADSLFGEGMRLYQERRFAESLDALTRARGQGADSVPTSFFAGIVHLIRGEASDADRELRVVARARPSPYASEAHFYLAKSWLQRGNADSARAHLERALAAGALPSVASAARALADSVARVTGDPR